MKCFGELRSLVLEECGMAGGRKAGPATTLWGPMTSSMGPCANAQAARPQGHPGGRRGR